MLSLTNKNRHLIKFIAAGIAVPALTIYMILHWWFHVPPPVCTEIPVGRLHSDTAPLLTQVLGYTPTNVLACARNEPGSWDGYRRVVVMLPGFSESELIGRIHWQPARDECSQAGSLLQETLNYKPSSSTVLTYNGDAPHCPKDWNLNAFIITPAGSFYVFPALNDGLARYFYAP